MNKIIHPPKEDEELEALLKEVPKIRYWTDEEIAYLKKYYRWPIPIQKLAKKLNRPYESVRGKAKQLGLKWWKPQ